MKRTFLAAIMVFISLALIGCGGGGGTPTIVTQILSDPEFDGDIVQFPPGVFTITQNNTESVFAGIDPFTFAEYRAFLDFPLTGVGGVPGNAVIVSAVLDIVIDSIQPQPLFGTIPIRIDLVSFQPPTLITSDFDRNSLRPLATTTIIPPISQADLGQHVFVDVTSLMTEAQRLGLPDFQIRILEDFWQVSPGLIEINDTTGPNRVYFAPLLQVEYF
jgi:hypothetical protein